MKILYHQAVLGTLVLLSGCAVGPDYKPAEGTIPASFTAEGIPWKVAVPADAVAKGAWWEIYEDPELNRLEKLASDENQDIRAAMARVEEARALSRLAKSEFLPAVSANPSGSFFRDSANRPVPPPAPAEQYTSSDVTLPLDLSYEADIWGRVRRSYEASKADFQASEADLETIRLTLHAELAQSYLLLRSLDAESDILQNTIALRRRSLELIQERFQNGANSDLEVAQAENALATAQADEAGIGQQRASVEHAIAVLVGQPAQVFQLAVNGLQGLPPSLPLAAPSELLERRPDVAQAERNMASANARIGVAKAAFFPVVKLTGTAGLESVDVGSVINWSSRLWAVGPSVSLPLFDAGRNSANYSRAEAAYRESVAQYRQSVLISFQEVEDGLTNTGHLAEQAVALDRAVEAARRAYDISNARYKEGSESYLEVIDAQRVWLQNQRQAEQIRGQRFVTSVLLVKALGGGWADSSIKSFYSHAPQ